VAPVVPLPSLFSIDDYPAAALRAGEEGAVTYRLDVGEAGQVLSCNVMLSSGSPMLDATTCRLLTMRARFTPARDSRGMPVGDSIVGRIVWKLEAPPEPVPPPALPPPRPPRQGT
jgi:protein TonB